MPPHVPFVAPGQIPMSTVMPPPAPATKSGMMWLGIIALAIGGYYYYNHHNTTPAQQPGAAPTAPGPQAQPGNPQQPGGYPGQQQPGGQGNPNQAVLQAQHFSGQYSAVNGAVQVTQGVWQNGSNYALQAATLECEQFSQAGQGLAQHQTMLNGPAGPGQTISFPTFTIGSVAQGAATVKCVIVAVTPETQ
jgi:hypothetical protein